MVQMHDGQHARICPFAVEVQLDIDAFKRLLQRAREQTVRPLIKVANYQSSMLQVRRKQHVTAHQQPRLLAPFDIAGPQMNVENVDNLARCDLYIAADTAALLTPRSSQVIDGNFLHRKPAEQHVAVCRAAQLARLTDAELIAYSVRQILRLILLLTTAAETYHLLQRDHVRIELAQYLRHARGADPAIHATALMRVVRGYAKPGMLLHRYLFLSIPLLLFTGNEPAQPLDSPFPERPVLPFFQRFPVGFGQVILKVRAQLACQTVIQNCEIDLVIPSKRSVVQIG